MKRNVFVFLIATLLVMAAVFGFCSSALANEYEITITPDKETVLEGETVTFSYAVIGDGMPDRIHFTCYLSYEDSDAWEKWADDYYSYIYDYSYTMDINRTELNDKVGSISIVAPRTGLMHGQIWVNDTYENANVIVEPNCGYEVTLKPDRDNITEGEQVTFTYSITGKNIPEDAMLEYRITYEDEYYDWGYYPTLLNSALLNGSSGKITLTIQHYGKMYARIKIGEEYYSEVKINVKSKTWADYDREFFPAWHPGYDPDVDSDVTKQLQVKMSVDASASILDVGDSIYYNYNIVGGKAPYKILYGIQTVYSEEKYHDGTYRLYTQTSNSSGRLVFPIKIFSYNGIIAEYLCPDVIISDATGRKFFWNFNESLHFRVEYQDLASVYLDCGNYEMHITKEQPVPVFQLNAEVFPKFRKDKSVIWSSSNPEVATVSDTGLVTAVGPGECKIHCRPVNTVLEHGGDACRVYVTSDFFIMTQPVSVVANPGETAVFSVTAKGEQAKYQWQYRESSTSTWKKCTASGAATPVVTVPVTESRHGFQYRCVITDANDNELITSVATLSLAGRTSILTNPENQTVSEGENAKFSIEATGDGLKYQWQYRASAAGKWNNTTATGAKTATLTIPGTASRNGYQYQCVITNQSGTNVTSTVATLTVRLPLQITGQPVDQTVESGSNAKFTVKATGTGLKYQWQYRASAAGKWANTTATGAKTATLTIPGTTSRNGYQYQCVITDQTGASITSSAATLTVQLPLQITEQPADQTVESGSNAKFTVKATGSGLKYQWQYRASSAGKWANTTASGAKTATLTIPGTASRNKYQYQCIITDQTGASITSSAATLTVQLPLQITEQPANQTAESGSNAKFTVKATGTGLKYQWQYKAPSATIWTKTSATGATTASLTIAVTAAKKGYQYRCVITDKFGKSINSDPATLLIPAELKITAQPADKTVADGTIAKFTVKAEGDGLKYQWQYRASSSGTWSNTSATGATTATLSVSATTAKNGYQYHCIIKDQYGNSVTSMTATMTLPVELKITSQPANKTVTAGTAAKFTVKAVGNGLKYQWYYRASSTASWTKTTATGATTATLTIPGTVSRNGYQYRCEITDQSGDKVTSSIVKLTVQ